MLFQVIITDRGSEFSDPEKIEADIETGEIQCRVFYCDPMNTNQKSNCERNHELIRYIIPKNHAKNENGNPKPEKTEENCCSYS